MIEALRAVLEDQGLKVQSVTPLTGGMINQATRLQTSEGPFFIKANVNAPPGLFQKEAEGLCALTTTQTVRVPKVLHFAEATSEAPAFLLLEWIESAAPDNQSDMTRRFAQDLAALHQAPAPEKFGWQNDNYLGELSQINTPCASWPQFYRECRLEPQISLAQARKLLPVTREKLLHSLMSRLDDLLGDFQARPSLLHGDLWSGNYITSGEQTVLVDPAVYYGEREMEIAFIELFGDFPPGFIAAYQHYFPLQDGYQKRRPLHQLYPLLVHLNHFGETYGILLDNACRQILENSS
jgi:fructosamine-3-kinase